LVIASYFGGLFAISEIRLILFDPEEALISRKNWMNFNLSRRF
jgi:hypothetical protein